MAKVCNSELGDSGRVMFYSSTVLSRAQSAQPLGHFVWSEPICALTQELLYCCSPYIFFPLDFVCANLALTGLLLKT